MATDFCGNEIQPGDLVIYLEYRRTSAELKMGTVRQCAEHSATIYPHTQHSASETGYRAATSTLFTSLCVTTKAITMASPDVSMNPIRGAVLVISSTMKAGATASSAPTT